MEKKGIIKIKVSYGALHYIVGDLIIDGKVDDSKENFVKIMTDTSFRGTVSMSISLVERNFEKLRIDGVFVLTIEIEYSKERTFTKTFVFDGVKWDKIVEIVKLS